MTDEETGPVYLAVCIEDIAKSPKELYKSIKDVSKFVNSPEGKSINARFKKFGTPREALDFMASGDGFQSPRTNGAGSSTTAEPGSPFPSLSRPQMTELKKFIEKGDLEGFLKLVDQNPRFLVNIGGDVAAIVMEGFRYNALHIAAKSGQVEIVKILLKLINDLTFLTRLYATSEADAIQRQPFILKSYLNTPDKGGFDTPLHFASKFGKLGVVRELVKQPMLDRSVLNKAGKTALECACERYNESDKSEVLKEIRLAIKGVHVVLQRNEDDMAILEVTNSLDFSLKSTRISAIAGPFLSEIFAEEFKTNWKNVGKELKKSDADKGWEKVGRLMCENSAVGWAECWRFLDGGLKPVDLTSEEGLVTFEAFLKERKRNYAGTGDGKRVVKEEHVRRQLDFGILDDEPESGRGTQENSEEDDENEDDDDVFYDTVTDPEEIQNYLDDSLAELADQFATLSVNSPKRIQEKPKEEEDENFETPPTTPPPTFVIDQMPCKIDNDLFEVMCKVSSERLAKYPNVEQYVRKLGRLNPAERTNWPGVDSPRRFSKIHRF